MKRNNKTWWHWCSDKTWRYSNRYEVCDICGKRRPADGKAKKKNGKK